MDRNVATGFAAGSACACPWRLRDRLHHRVGPGSGVWQAAFNNNSTGMSFQTTANYASTESSVEWVEEAPVGNGGLLPLDNFSPVPFSQTTALASISDSSMSTRHRKVLAINVWRAASRVVA